MKKNKVTVSLVVDSYFPFYNFEFNGNDSPVVVDKVIAEKWQRVMQEFAEVQYEMKVASERTYGKSPW